MLPVSWPENCPGSVVLSWSNAEEPQISVSIDREVC